MMASTTQTTVFKFFELVHGGDLNEALNRLFSNLVCL